MKNKRIPLLFLLVLVVILGVSTSVSAVRPPVSGAQLILKPVRMEQGKDVRRSYYQVGTGEIKATLAQMGTQIHFTLWEGKQNVFHFSAPASRLGLGSSGAFMSDGHLFFYCNINTRAGWRPPQDVRSSSENRRWTVSGASTSTAATTTIRCLTIFRSISDPCSTAQIIRTSRSHSAASSIPTRAGLPCDIGSTITRTQISLHTKRNKHEEVVGRDRGGQDIRGVY